MNLEKEIVQSAGGSETFLQVLQITALRMLFLVILGIKSKIFTRKLFSQPGNKQTLERKLYCQPEVKNPNLTGEIPVPNQETKLYEI